MHGLVNRSLQCFLRDTYGTATWERVAQTAGVGPEGFEAMLRYDDRVFDRTLDAAARVLERPHDTILEDLGTYLVSHPNLESLRRLLRFGGVTFVDFLHSLEDLPGRGRLAVPDLDLPALELVDPAPDRYVLVCRGQRPGFGPVIVGILRAMADDYGALVLIEQEAAGPDREADTIRIDLLDQSFAEGRRFELSARAG